MARSFELEHRKNIVLILFQESRTGSGLVEK
jgi:hypothetical protein